MLHKYSILDEFQLWIIVFLYFDMCNVEITMYSGIFNNTSSISGNCDWVASKNICNYHRSDTMYKDIYHHF